MIIQAEFRKHCQENRKLTPPNMNNDLVSRNMRKSDNSKQKIKLCVLLTIFYEQHEIICCNLTELRSHNCKPELISMKNKAERQKWGFEI